MWNRTLSLLLLLNALIGITQAPYIPHSKSPAIGPNCKRSDNQANANEIKRDLTTFKCGYAKSSRSICRKIHCHQPIAAGEI